MPDLKKLAKALNIAVEGGEDYREQFWIALSDTFAAEGLSRAAHDVLRLGQDGSDYHRGYGEGYEIGYKEGYEESPVP